MKKLKLNLVIDAVMLIIMMAIIGIGLLVKYVLLTGQEKWDKFGENLDFFLLGLDRHEWGKIHFILGLILIGLLVLHTVLHWKMILNIFCKLIKNKKTRVFTAVAILFLSIILVSFPLFINPTVTGTSFKGRNMHSDMGKIETIRKDEHLNTVKEPITGGNTENKPMRITPQAEDHSRGLHRGEAHSPGYGRQNTTEDTHHNLQSEIDVRGNMTLLDIAEKYEVPADYIKRKLDIPLSTSNNHRLGQLRKVHGFTMSEVREIIYTYQKTK